MTLIVAYLVVAVLFFALELALSRRREGRMRPVDVVAAVAWGLLWPLALVAAIVAALTP